LVGFLIRKYINWLNLFLLKPFISRVYFKSRFTNTYFICRYCLLFVFHYQLYDIFMFTLNWTWSNIFADCYQYWNQTDRLLSYLHKRQELISKRETNHKTKFVLLPIQQEKKQLKEANSCQRRYKKNCSLFLDKKMVIAILWKSIDFCEQ